MKLFHIADLHIGRKSIDATAKARRINALRNAIGNAASLDADVILVAGDVFDSPDVDPQVVKVAARILDSAMKATGEQIPVVVIAGNHDPSDSLELWTRFQAELSDCTSVNLALRPTAFELCDGKLFVEAYPNEYRYSPNPPWHHRARVNDVDASATRVVLAHGTLQGGKVRTGESDSYPFTIEDAESLGADFVALGHFHSTYPAWANGEGSEQRSVSFAGTHEPDRFGQDSGYALFVDVEPGQSARVRRISVSVSEWRLIKIETDRDLESLLEFASKIDQTDDPSRFKLRIQPERGLKLTSDQLSKIECVVASLEALGVEVQRRGEFELSMELEDLDFDSLPSGAIAETIIELKAELQTSSDETLLPVFQEAIRLGWLQLNQEV